MGFKVANTLEDSNPADLNLDGIADLADWTILNPENPSMGATILAVFARQSVPEPRTIIIAVIALTAVMIAVSGDGI